MKADAARFLSDLHALRQIGRFKTGAHRPTSSPEDMESREWLMRRMEEAGLEPEMDGVGNVLGRHRESGPKLLAGSHIESQNEAGWLDGALGAGPRRRNAVARGAEPRRGTEAQNMAPIMPAAMLFTPSIGGISHHWAEDAKEEDLALGLEVMLAGAERILAG